MKKITRYFTKGELLLWLCSVVPIVVSFLLFGGSGAATLAASLIGVTAILFNAKGHPAGQVLMIMFSLLYGIISFTFAYYGEMITYLGMTMPMAIVSLIAWLRHPFQGDRAQVKVGAVGRTETVLMFLLAAGITAAFYFILAAFHTANLIPSTVSVTTSFLAVYLTFRRSPYFNLAYAANDMVLIVLWVLAAAADRRYLSVMVCFAAFFVNDIYAFISWRRLKARQAAAAETR